MLIPSSLYSLTYKPGRLPTGLSPLTIPNQIGSWTRVQDLTISNAAYKALDPDSLIIREYRNDKNHRLSLTIVYHENARWGAHNPQVCYKSQGWRILSSNKRGINTLLDRAFEINQFAVTKNDSIYLISYWWYTSGKRQMASRLKHMFYMSLNGFLHGHIESGFVSLSTSVSGYSEESSQKIVNDFCASFVPILESSIN